MFKCLKVLTVFCVLCGWQSSLWAEDLPAPEGPVILTISGAIQNTNTSEGLQFDLKALQSMEPVTFKTSTIWLPDVVEFTGVSLKSVLDQAKAKGTRINAIALNDYKIEIPVETLEQNQPIIAYLMDGAEMSPRDKGPLWIVYPYDSDAKFRTEVIYSRSIWQLDRIDVVE